MSARELRCHRPDSPIHPRPSRLSASRGGEAQLRHPGGFPSAGIQRPEPLPPRVPSGSSRPRHSPVRLRPLSPTV
jgi:hypothetical protein